MPNLSAPTASAQADLTGSNSLADLAALGKLQRDPRHERLCEAAYRGKTCGGCGRELTSEEPIWRRAEILGPGLFGGTRMVTAPFCSQCKRRYWPDVVWSGPCPVCGRMVHNMERRWRRWNFCCHDHQRQHQSSYQAGIARQQRAQARGPSRPCAECNEYFEPTRAHAQFCSRRCKQKAYRKRVTLAKCACPYTSGNRNADTERFAERQP
jgi:hypothetical protein